LQELADWAGSEVRGEVTLVIGGAATPIADLESAAKVAVGLAADGMKLKAAVAQVAQQEGVAKNALYELALRMNHLRHP
jgi:16S rRNA (cytidine1402-2'-O)-methyltransferase